MTHALPLLEVKGLALSFGGVKAIAGVSFSVRPGDLFAIIGPNGAGKTSILNCLSGLYQATAGSIVLAGHELVGRAPAVIARQGVARTFQNLGLFEHLSVIDNVLLGRHALMSAGMIENALFAGRTRAEETAHRARTHEIIDSLGLGTMRDAAIEGLPYGTRKLVELARALAMEPKLFLLDEPVAGMNREETERMSRIILEIRRSHNVAMILVEHDMQMVMSVSDRVMVIDFGQHVATGTPAEIQSHPRVIEAYLGRAA